jgi:hypothetical protein
MRELAIIPRIGARNAVREHGWESKRLVAAKESGDPERGQAYFTIANLSRR